LSLDRSHNSQEQGIVEIPRTHGRSKSLHRRRQLMGCQLIAALRRGRYRTKVVGYATDAAEFVRTHQERSPRCSISRGRRCPSWFRGDRESGCLRLSAIMVL
jgi:hypothetical protein